MKLENGENFHLQPLLEAVKGELVESLQQFYTFMQQTPLIDVAKTCSSPSSNCKDGEVGENNLETVASTFDAFQGQVEYIRSFLSLTKIFPKNVKRELGWKVFRDCDSLWKCVLKLLARSVQCGKEDEENCEKYGTPQVVLRLVLPTEQLIHDCLDVNTVLLVGSDQDELFDICTRHAMSMFGESMRFLASPQGTPMEKSDFLRIMGLCQKLWKFSDHTKSLPECKEVVAAISRLINVQVETVEEVFNEQMLTLLSFENGRSLVKFWCEVVNNSSGKESRILCKGLNRVSSLHTAFPEIYMIFTSYMQDDWFWKTDTGKGITPVIIRGIIQDMSSDKTETRKRAAFVLQLLVAQYSQNRPIFDSSIPEARLISLHQMNPREYMKFWAAYFDLHDILNETQIHIVQPVLHKLKIFQEYSSTNASVLVWLPIILKKMVSHDNRAVVKEGFVQFLSTGAYLNNLNEDAEYRSLAKDFLEKYIMPLIRDHIGWVLNDPEEFFKNIGRFGEFLARLQIFENYPELKAGEIILNFLTSAGKCMGPHTILFMVAALDEILCEENIDKFGIKNDQSNIISASKNENMEHCVNVLISQLALLVSNNLTTVSKYFRELLEHRCISILFKITPLIKSHPEASQMSPVFTKLLAFLGSISGIVFCHAAAREKLQFIVATLGEKEANIVKQLLMQSNMYDQVKRSLSYTSTIGLLRFLAILPRTGNKQISEGIQETVERFTLDNCTRGILPGSIQGLAEFYQGSCEQRCTGSEVVLNRVFETLKQIDNGDHRCLTESFMNCVQSIELLSVLPVNTWTNKNLPSFESSSSIKMFLLQKLYTLKGTKQTFSANVFKDEILDQGFDSVENINAISDSYHAVTSRNLLAEYHQVKFMLYTSIFKSELNVDRNSVKKVLQLLVDEIEKCDSKGVIAGLLLAKAVSKHVSFDEDRNEIHELLEEIVSVGWSLVFELRKTEAFWLGIKTFVELIACPFYIKNGFLHKYADLLFEHGETISGLSLALVEELVKIDYSIELWNEVNKVLVKAALAGGALPKNNRMSFAIWEYLRKESNEPVHDPEHFSSDCKSRLLACEKICANIKYALSVATQKEMGLQNLRTCVLSVLENSEFESERKRRYFQGSYTHRIKQRIWQLLLILQPRFDFDTSKLVLEKALTSLSNDSPQPSVRYMAEWLIILIIQRYPELCSILFDCLDNCMQKRLGFGAFFSTICLQLSKLLKCPKFYDKALQSLATLVLSQHITVRIYSQVTFQRIYERAGEMSFSVIVQKYAPVISALSRASLFVSGNCSKLLDNISQDFYINVFDSITHYCPEVIFTLLPRLAGVVKDECILLPETITKLVLKVQASNTGLDGNSDILLQAETLQKIYMDNEKSAWHLKTIVADGRELGEEIPKEKLDPPTQTVKTEDTQITEMYYQKKINPWKLLSASDEIEDYANKINSKKRCVDEEGLIVVASLLDHLPNLGGLCRTCEIFGVHKYVVSSLKVVNDQQFQNLSVSAQNWVNILEVPARDLESFLFTYSAKGYTILGVEQANESSSLTNFCFPKKSVLLLGNEKLGIPPELLRLVDKCIEIPQVGIIRSLNVHVTGALCIWQYACQNIF